MADEISLTISMLFNKGGATATRSESMSVDVTGDAFTHEVQQIGTSEEEVAQGTDLGTPGYMFCKNLDATNYIEIGVTTGVYTVKLKAKEFACFRVAGATILAKATGGACNLEYLLIED